jgi:dTDP-glucose 4,6-dehydratase
MDTMIVTGGAGFIGSSLVRLALARTSARVIVVDKLTYAGSLDNLAEVEGDPRFTFVKADICDGGAVRGIFREYSPGAVVNLAAETHVDRSIDGPRAFVTTNVGGTFELLDAARDHFTRLDASGRATFRFLQVSTDEVYGSLGAEGVFREDSPYAPRSPYAASKASADHFARAYHETFDLPVIVTNSSNNYGPRQFPEKLIPLMILSAAEGKPLPIYGDGGNVRDWIYVDDHAEGILDALAKGKPGQSYNLGGGSERTNLEVVDRICDVLDVELPAAKNVALAAKGVRRYQDLKTFVPDRPGHDRRYALDTTLARGELGWRPRHDFESGLASTVRWYLGHPEWRTARARRYEGERLGLGTSGRGPSR